MKPQGPHSIAVMYSDCARALSRIAYAWPDRRLVTLKIISQSIKLEQLKVEVQLHWIPGHRNIPGNELTNIVSRMARRPLE